MYVDVLHPLQCLYNFDAHLFELGLFFVAAPIAGAFSGIIAYGVDKNLDGVSGLHSWQWLFILEGVPTIAWGILMLLLTPSLPDTVSQKGSILFKTEEEKRLILQRTVAGMYKLHVRNL